VFSFRSGYVLGQNLNVGRAFRLINWFSKIVSAVLVPGLPSQRVSPGLRKASKRIVTSKMAT